MQPFMIHLTIAHIHYQMRMHTIDMGIKLNIRISIDFMAEHSKWIFNKCTQIQHNTRKYYVFDPIFYATFWHMITEMHFVHLTHSNWSIMQKFSSFKHIKRICIVLSRFITEQKREKKHLKKKGEKYILRWIRKHCSIHWNLFDDLIQGRIKLTMDRNNEISHQYCWFKHVILSVQFSNVLLIGEFHELSQAIEPRFRFRQMFSGQFLLGLLSSRFDVKKVTYYMYIARYNAERDTRWILCIGN